MKNINRFLKITNMLLGCLFTFVLQAASLTHEAEQTIEALYHNPQLKKNADIQERVVWFSQQFLDKPYLLGALGEGPHARFDQYPIYRTDAFDCETYVDTVLALALADNLANFKEKILKIRYKAGKRAFIHRNHFTDLDWNLNNQAQGFIKDITPHFKGIEKQQATAVINKPAWYLNLPLASIRHVHPNAEKRQERLKELHQKAGRFSPQKITILYLPLNGLFDAKGHAKSELFAQIPQAAIIEIVRPNWDLEKATGTRLNISHLGFAIWKNKVLYFREASSEYHRVVDVPLEDYLRKALNSPTIRGINVQVVKGNKSLPNDPN